MSSEASQEYGITRRKFPPDSHLVCVFEPANVAGADPSTAFADPEGYTASQILAFGSLGHVHGIGMVLGLRAMGMI